MDLSDKQWDLIQDILQAESGRNYQRGRPRKDIRSVLNGILWVKTTGAFWKDLPKKYPSYQTCNQYYRKWLTSGDWENILSRLGIDLGD